MPVTTRPDVAGLLDYCNLSGNNYDTADAQDALDAAEDVQNAVCVTDPYTDALAEALLRRAQAILVARGAALGTLDAGDFGISPLLRYDAKIGELEAPYLRGGFA